MNETNLTKKEIDWQKNSKQYSTKGPQKISQKSNGKIEYFKLNFMKSEFKFLKS